MDREKYRREYYNPPIKQPKKAEPIEHKIHSIVLILLLLVIFAISGYYIHIYKVKARIEASELQVGQIWKERIIRPSIYTAQPETIVVKKEITGLEDNKVFFNQEEPDTTYSFDGDFTSFKQDSYKVKN